MMRGIRYVVLALFVLPLLFSCTATRNYDPNKKFSPEVLRKDFVLLQNILEQKHPSLYWYTSRDSMDVYFEDGFNAITDSMTELQFGWRTIAPLLTKIRCGHTSFMMSKGWSKFINGKHIPSFPLYMKVWDDSMMVVRNMNGDSLIPPGNFITGINGMPDQLIIQRLLGYMPTDGYSENLNYIKLSASFPYFYRNVFGIYPYYAVTFNDSLSKSHQGIIKWWLSNKKEDSLVAKKSKRKKHIPASVRRSYIRSMEIKGSTAIMPVNAFSKGNLKTFFRRSFKEMRKKQVKNLVIDLRINGGGDINKAVALGQYICNKPFKVCDSAFSAAKNFNPYSRYISNSFWNNIALIFVSKKLKDGKYHFGYWERHFFKPKKKNHFNGHVYVLTNGLTFSAASLFCNLVKGQENVTLTGEETGGGWYGNSGILIPTITLPNTHLRVRLPFFRLVQYHHPPVKGTGVIPDWYIGPNWRDVLNDEDTKMNAVMKKIEEENK